MSDTESRLGAYATLTADDLVTGEAVALDLPPASLGLRMVSGLLDFLATGVAFLGAIFTLVIVASSWDAALGRVAMIGAIVIPLVVFPVTMETLTRGRTLGKLAMGLRTVRDDAGPISFQHAFVRALIGLVEIYVFFGGPAFLSAMMNGRGKRLGDFAAGTYVVRERVRLALNPPPLMPWALTSWGASADIAALPTQLALAIRQFLSRAPQLDPVSRHTLGVRLADETSKYVAPQPPRGTPPEAFLAAVIAARRDRDSARLHREHALRARLLRRP